MRRDASMIDRQRPEPELKPSPEWAADVDAQEFNRRWEAERRLANPAPIQETHKEKVQMPNQSQDNANQGPADVIRDGRLKATIWQNSGENGPFWSVEFAKTITDQNGNAKDVRSFSQTETLRISELSREAYGRVNSLKKEWSQEQLQSQEQTKMQFKQSRQKTSSKKQSMSHSK